MPSDHVAVAAQTSKRVLSPLIYIKEPLGILFGLGATGAAAARSFPSPSSTSMAAAGAVGALL